MKLNISKMVIVLHVRFVRNFAKSFSILFDFYNAVL
jgi:hypothetical protein